MIPEVRRVVVRTFENIFRLQLSFLLSKQTSVLYPQYILIKPKKISSSPAEGKNLAYKSCFANDWIIQSVIFLHTIFYLYASDLKKVPKSGIFKEVLMKVRRSFEGRYRIENLDLCYYQALIKKHGGILTCPCLLLFFTNIFSLI